MAYLILSVSPEEVNWNMCPLPSRIIMGYMFLRFSSPWSLKFWNISYYEIYKTIKIQTKDIKDISKCFYITILHILLFLILNFLCNLNLKSLSTITNRVPWQPMIHMLFTIIAGLIYGWTNISYS